MPGGGRATLRCSQEEHTWPRQFCSAIPYAPTTIPARSSPESGARLRAIEDALAAESFETLERREAPVGDPESLALAHDKRLVDSILANVPGEGRVAIDADTVMSPASGEAARRAAGALTAAVDAVLGGEADNAFCAVRPPAPPCRAAPADGVLPLQQRRDSVPSGRGAPTGSRASPWSTSTSNHGNGTQAAFEEDGDLFFGSTHQSPLYPGTGAAHETGVGNIVNAPLSAGHRLGRLPRRDGEPPAAGAPRSPPGADPDLGRLRRAHATTRWRTWRWSRTTTPGSPPSWSGSRASFATATSSRPWRAATTCAPSARAPQPTSKR